jgi:hypothetical protein
VDPAYSFQFSDGIGNSSIQAVPEPSSIVLLSTGAIAIGLLRRRSEFRLLWRNSLFPNPPAQAATGDERNHGPTGGWAVPPS